MITPRSGSGLVDRLDDVEKAVIETQVWGVRIIDKTESLDNPAGARSLHPEHDVRAADQGFAGRSGLRGWGADDPHVDALREKMEVTGTSASPGKIWMKTGAPDLPGVFAV